MTREEREEIFVSCQTAPNMEELKKRFTVAAKKAIAENDAVSLRILTAWKDETKRVLAERDKQK